MKTYDLAPLNLGNKPIVLAAIVHQSSYITQDYKIIIKNSMYSVYQMV